tara:strand:- start:233 stop:631 length:399 start_codon:yes stop_codon:yes gene_type:complete
MTKEEMAARLGRFEDWTEGEIAYIIGELNGGMGLDRGERFDGYWGAHMALNIAQTFVSLGDEPRANEMAIAWIGALAAYALDSTYWDNETVPAQPGDCGPEYATVVCALSVIEMAARPIQYRHGLQEFHQSQ